MRVPLLRFLKFVLAFYTFQTGVQVMAGPLENLDWMRDDASRLKVWIEKSNAEATKELQKGPYFKEFELALKAASSSAASVSDISPVNGMTFFQGRNAEDQQDSLFAFRADEPSKIQTLVSGTSLGKGSRLHYYSPSPQGNYLVFGVTENDSEMADMRLFSKSKGTIEKLPINQLIFPMVRFLPDETSFVYLRNNNLLNADPAQRNLGISMRVHKIGDNPEKDVVVAATDMLAEPKLTDADRFRGFDALNGGSIASLIVRRGTSNPRRLYYKNMKDLREPKQAWIQVFGEEAKVFHNASSEQGMFVAGENDGVAFVDKIAFNHSKPERVVFQTLNGKSIFALIASRDALYVGVRDGLTASLLRVDYKTKKTEVLPANPGEDFTSVYGSALQDGVIIKRESFKTPTEYIQWKGSSAPSPLALVAVNRSAVPKLSVDVHYAKSHDGTEVPMWLVYEQKTKLTPNTPVLIDAYGSYADITRPQFDPYRNQFYARGGAIAYCMPRGGGELGRSWHEQGRRAKKINTPLDVIACAQHLIDRKLTRSAKLALYTSSAGGLISAYMVKHQPTLFRALVTHAGIVNVLELFKQSIGASNITEFGDPNIKEEWEVLIQLDGYEGLEKVQVYPALLAFHGSNDPRVPVWFSTRFAARLKNLQQSDRPMLFYSDLTEGHGLASTTDQNIQQWAKTFAFLASQLDMH